MFAKFHFTFTFNLLTKHKLTQCTLLGAQPGKAISCYSNA